MPELRNILALFWKRVRNKRGIVEIVRSTLMLVVSEFSGEITFMRGCMNTTGYSGDPCDDASNIGGGTNVKVIRCDTCKKDACNSGSQFSASTLLFALVLVFPLLNSLRRN